MKGKIVRKVTMRMAERVVENILQLLCGERLRRLASLGRWVLLGMSGFGIMDGQGLGSRAYIGI